MTNTTTANEPKLGAPGAGLPFPELVIANILFRWRIRGKSPKDFAANLRNERAKIAALVRSCDSTSLCTRVLIPRPRGLEDSSRNWSVLMTLDHLRIVNRMIADTIASLGKGVVPANKVSTALVKPNANVTAAVLTDYEASCETLLTTAAEVPDLHTRVRHPHPWFGMLDAARWLALAGGHMGMHRGQIKQIIAGLLQANNGHAV